MSNVYIGHASISEDGTMYGKQIGDQTGKEVCIRKYWNTKDGWLVLRPYDSIVGRRIAEAMIELCNNDNCGYNASTRQRNTGILLLVKYGRIADIKEPFSTDCSSAVRLCLKQAGINLPNFSTRSEAKTLGNCGYFNKGFVLVNELDLREGDILLTSGHTAIVVSTDGLPDQKAEPKKIKTNLLRKFLGK